MPVDDLATDGLQRRGSKDPLKNRKNSMGVSDRPHLRIFVDIPDFPRLVWRGTQRITAGVLPQPANLEPWTVESAKGKKRRIERGKVKAAILTPINEAVVVLLERLCSVSLAGERDCGTALGAAIAVKVQV